MSSRFPHSAEVRRDGFSGKLCNRRVKSNDSLFLTAKPAYGDGAISAASLRPTTSSDGTLASECSRTL